MTRLASAPCGSTVSGKATDLGGSSGPRSWVTAIGGCQKVTRQPVEVGAVGGGFATPTRGSATPTKGSATQLPSCGPVLTQGGVRNVIRRLTNTHSTGLEHGEDLYFTSRGSIFGRPVETYTVQTDDSVSWDPVGLPGYDYAGNAHSHVYGGGVTTVLHDWFNNIAKPWIRIVVAPAYAFLIPAYPSSVGIHVTEACAQ